MNDMAITDRGPIAQEMHERLIDLSADLETRGQMTEDSRLMLNRLFSLADQANELETNMLIAEEDNESWNNN